MAKTILNVTRGFYMKRSRAERAITEECACAWVEYGVSVRDLTLAESIKARNEQAALREPLAYAELPGIVYSGPTNYALIRAAHEFAAGV